MNLRFQNIIFGQTKWQRATLIILLCVLGIGVFVADAGKKSASKPAPVVLTAPEIVNYKSWPLATQQAQMMEIATATACIALPTPAPTIVPPPTNSSHPESKGKFVRVYVNEKGRRVLLRSPMLPRNSRFPVGSVIVKEKLPTKDSKTPELLTVMIKQRAGYDPKKGDWEYLVTDGDGKTVQARGKLENCQSCHVRQAKNDYVFRSYMPGV